jgi:hypothetical protein
MNDSQITIYICAVDPYLPETRGCQRKQSLQDELGRRMMFSVHPRHLRFQAVAARGKEIIFDFVERHHRGNIPVLLRNRSHQA